MSKELTRRQMGEPDVPETAELCVRRWYWREKHPWAKQALVTAHEHPKLSNWAFSLFWLLLFGMSFGPALGTSADAAPYNWILFAGNSIAVLSLLALVVPLTFLLIPYADTPWHQVMEHLPELPEDLSDEMLVPLLDLTERWIDTQSNIRLNISDHLLPARISAKSSGFEEFRATRELLKQMTVEMRRYHHAVAASNHVDDAVMKMVPDNMAAEARREFEALAEDAEISQTLFKSVVSHAQMRRELNAAVSLPAVK